MHRGFVLQQIEGIGSNLEGLEPTLQGESDGTVTVSDPGNRLLLASASAIQSLLDAQYGKFVKDKDGKLTGAEAIASKAAVDAYVEAVTQRNAQVCTSASASSRSGATYASAAPPPAHSRTRCLTGPRARLGSLPSG